ncbi:MAG: hypothetical protein V3S01_05115 [Dehalococcoidia bacterium]
MVDPIPEADNETKRFAPLFEGVLSTLHEEEAYGVEIDSAQVSFAIGFESELIQRLLRGH